MRQRSLIRPLAAAVLLCLGCSSSDAPTAANEEPSSGGSAGTAATSGESAGASDQGAGGAAGKAFGAATGVGGAGSASAGASGQGGSGGIRGAGGTGISGSSGSAGKGDSGTAPVLAACPQDGKGAVGVWENISPPNFATPSNMETLAVAVNPKSGSVFAAAGNKTSGGNSGTGVWQSTDCGKSFSLVSTGTKSANLLTGDPWAMLIDPVNPENMYINNGYGDDPTLYKSSNGGVDWAELSVDPDNVVPFHFVQAIAMDPGNPKHLAVTFHEDCDAPYNHLCLSQTSDGGATWHLFNGPAGLGWQEAASITVIGPSSYLFTGPGAWYTPDGGKTWSHPVSPAIFGSYGGGAIAGPDGTLYLGVTNNGVNTSPGPMPGAKWSPIPGSPQTSVMIQDGASLFATFALDSSGQPFYTAPLSDITHWTHMKTPTISRGSNMFAADSSRHIVYAANWSAGLWRLVTR